MAKQPAGPGGLVIVDKPGGMTSHDVVSRIRRLAHTRRVGHAGTLDPMATGVLVLGVEKATRLLGHLTLTEKAYDATIRLGESTITDDAEGEVVTSADASGASLDAVRAQMSVLTGDIMQVPSAVSAIKIDGQRSYARVRSGEDVSLPARPVTVFSFELLASRVVGSCFDLDVSVRCSSGTYIRALARDLGAALGVGGHLTALRRTAVGAFTLKQAVPLDDLLEAGENPVSVPLADAAAQTFVRRDLDAEDAEHVLHGRFLTASGGAEPVAVFGPDGRFLALVQDKGGKARPVAVFAETV
ncbi:tRNA pseudouridine(55) synthase TruB [Fodinicola acaciae]|uniref:tRNA pseudouridine(55) synthase TruB n=1 Tax=Fodinicola acaciae TaxID=2681555 RepID=UPI002483AF59|nr:tRNA pseudouridine(55) synthase TruB [Fodinicola acaciae]